MRRGLPSLLAALSLALAAVPTGPVAAQQFLLPESLSPDRLAPLREGEGGLRLDRPRGRVQNTLEVPTDSAPGGVLRGLDRISGETRDLDLATGAEGELFGRLRVTLIDCRFPEGDPASNAFAYVTVEDTQHGGSVFQGWMVAASPALNAMDHARFDVWALRCNSS